MNSPPPQFFWKDCAKAFRILHESGLYPIVVGGQAVNLWLDYFGAQMSQFATPIASKDVDVLGDRAFAHQCATALKAKCKDINRAKHAVPMNAIIYLGAEQDGLKIDFQDGAEPNAGEELQQAAVEIPTDLGPVRVMHPLHCLKTRAYNVVGIHQDGKRKYANEHGRGQLRAAMLIFKAFMQEVASTERGPRKVLRSYESLVTFAKGQWGDRLWELETINLLDCILPLPELGPAFRMKRYPQICSMLARD